MADLAFILPRSARIVFATLLRAPTGVERTRRSQARMQRCRGGRRVGAMTWLGGLVLGLGLLLVAALAGSRIMRIVRQRAVSRAAGASYAGRLDVGAETGDQDDIARTADALIREHGAAAVIEAARRTLSSLDDGDLKSRAVWRQVLASAEESRRKDRPQDEAAE